MTGGCIDSSEIFERVDAQVGLLRVGKVPLDMGVQKICGLAGRAAA